MLQIFVHLREIWKYKNAHGKYSMQKYVKYLKQSIYYNIY